MWSTENYETSEGNIPLAAVVNFYTAVHLSSCLIVVVFQVVPEFHTDMHNRTNYNVYDLNKNENILTMFYQTYQTNVWT